MEKKIRLFLLVGIPCSGKSTWVKNNIGKLSVKYNAPVLVISRDTIREGLKVAGRYYWNKKQENEVTEKFYSQMRTAVAMENAVIILDNMHIRDSYIQSYTATFQAMLATKKMEMYMVIFKVPYWLAYIRNIWRNITTKKWIPIKALKEFYKVFNNMDLDKYKQHIYEQNMA